MSWPTYYNTIQWVLNTYSTTKLQLLGKYIYVYKGIMRGSGWPVAVATCTCKW